MTPPLSLPWLFVDVRACLPTLANNLNGAAASSGRVAKQEVKLEAD